MIDATEDYHTCTVCSTTVHDFGPGADAVLFRGQWFHKECFIEENPDRQPTSAEEDAYSALDFSYPNVPRMP